MRNRDTTNGILIGAEATARALTDLLQGARNRGTLTDQADDKIKAAILKTLDAINLIDVGRGWNSLD